MEARTFSCCYCAGGALFLTVWPFPYVLPVAWTNSRLVSLCYPMLLGTGWPLLSGEISAGPALSGFTEKG